MSNFMPKERDILEEKNCITGNEQRDRKRSR